MKERRKQPRVEVALRAVVRGNHSKSWKAKTLDVSSGGALLDSPRSLGQGAQIELLFELNEVEIAPVQARVLRCHSAFWGRRHTVAVEFEETVPELVQTAENAIKNRRKKIAELGLKPAAAG